MMEEEWLESRWIEMRVNARWNKMRVNAICQRNEYDLKFKMEHTHVFVLRLIPAKHNSHATHP